MSKSTKILSPSSKPVFIGEGTYGCTHRPALRCKITPIKQVDYTTAISKIGEKEELKEEMKKYNLIDKADPDFRFHLSNTQICQPDLSTDGSNMEAIDSCSIGKDIKKNPSKFMLMLMKYGGLDLDKYFKEISVQGNEESVQEMWSKCLNLLKGIKTFLEHGIVHNDVKGKNIVFNQETKEAKFIDFGMMEKIKDAKKACTKGDYHLAIVYWNLPFESLLTTKTNFDYLREHLLDEPNKVDYFITKYTEDTKKNHNWLKYLFGYLEHGDSGIKGEKRLRLIESSLNDLRDFLVKEFLTMSYQEFLTMYFSKLDLYGLGLAFMYGLSYTRKYMTGKIATRFQDLFMKMSSFHLVKRVDVESAIREMENILADWETGDSGNVAMVSPEEDSYSMDRVQMGGIRVVDKGKTTMMVTEFQKELEKDPPKNGMVVTL